MPTRAESLPVPSLERSLAAALEALPDDWRHRDTRRHLFAAREALRTDAFADVVERHRTAGLPGHPLRLERDAGGWRYYLNGQAVHAGTGLELLVRRHIEYLDEDGREYRVRVGWLAVRLEFRLLHHLGPEHQQALVCVPATGLGAAPVDETARFRWPT